MASARLHLNWAPQVRPGMSGPGPSAQTGRLGPGHIAAAARAGSGRLPSDEPPDGSNKVKRSICATGSMLSGALLMALGLGLALARPRAIAGHAHRLCRHEAPARQCPPGDRRPAEARTRIRTARSRPECRRGAPGRDALALRARQRRHEPGRRPKACAARSMRWIVRSSAIARTCAAS